VKAALHLEVRGLHPNNQNSGGGAEARFKPRWPP
jgi:hypothetical protein